MLSDIFSSHALLHTIDTCLQMWMEGYEDTSCDLITNKASDNTSHCTHIHRVDRYDRHLGDTCVWSTLTGCLCRDKTSIHLRLLSAFTHVCVCVFLLAQLLLHMYLCASFNTTIHVEFIQQDFHLNDWTAQRELHEFLHSLHPVWKRIRICGPWLWFRVECEEVALRYLPVVGDTPVDVLHPLGTHGAEAYLQSLWDHVTAGTQPAAHLHQCVVITRQRLQDLVR